MYWHTVFKLHIGGCLKSVHVKRMVCGASCLEVNNYFHISLLLPKKPFVATVQGKGNLSHLLSNSKFSKSAAGDQYHSIVTSPVP